MSRKNNIPDEIIKQRREFEKKKLIAHQISKFRETDQPAESCSTCFNIEGTPKDKPKIAICREFPILPTYVKTLHLFTCDHWTKTNPFYKDRYKKQE